MRQPSAFLISFGDRLESAVDIPALVFSSSSGQVQELHSPEATFPGASGGESRKLWKQV